MTDFGMVSVDGQAAAVRFERWYAAEAAELWGALTEPARMARWLGAEVHIEARVGGAVSLRWAGGEEMDGVITVLEPGRVLAYTWREPALGVESVVRFELRPADSGTVLVLEHTGVPAGQAAGFGAGWHGHLDALAGTLAGQDIDPQARYRELTPEYARRSGSGGSDTTSQEQQQLVTQAQQSERDLNAYGKI
jgi:uncharacterized protein YndB with AHSA1/START domain